MTGRTIAARIAKFFKDGDVINLGIGLPTAVADFIPPDVKVFLNSENGFIGLGPTPVPECEDKDVVNAGGQLTTILPGGACYDIAMSLAIIRGGHLSGVVLGALEVDRHGNPANRMVPGSMGPGMGGAMDLVAGARKVIIAMEHTTKEGKPKILENCTYPLTTAGKVNYIVTELGLLEITEEGVVLRELAPGIGIEEIVAKTETRLIIPAIVHEWNTYQGRH